MSAFAIYRSQEGDLTLRNHLGKVPVNPAYLEHLLDARLLTVEPGQFCLVDPLLAEDAIEESLAFLGHQITTAEIHKRRLLNHLAQARNTSASPTSRSPEVARRFGFSEVDKQPLAA